eukprot:INCI16735.2.p1 GENE.INCI16735.2~~INCI16735.2.p1  ORF type:complete len:629 (-),score=118.43 INCI16735.2:1039-2925(-)
MASADDGGSPSSPPVPPAGAAWAALRDPKTKRVYFHNHLTKETTWAPPQGVLKAGWRMSHHPTKGSYFYHRESKETSWQVPHAFSRDERRRSQTYWLQKRLRAHQKEQDKLERLAPSRKKKNSPTALAAAAANAAPASAADAPTKATAVDDASLQAELASPRHYDSLRDACKAGDAAAVKFFLDSHARLVRSTREQSASDSSANIPSRTELLEECSLKGETCVFVAALHGHADVVEILLRAGANADARNLRGLTALHKATMLGHVRVVNVLLKCGADPLLRDSRGRTAAELAEKFRKPQAASAIRRRSSIDKVRALVIGRKFLSAAFHDSEANDSGGTTSNGNDKQGTTNASSDQSRLDESSSAQSQAGHPRRESGTYDVFKHSITLTRVRRKLRESLSKRRARSAHINNVRGSAVGRFGAIASGKRAQGLHRSNWHSGDLEDVAEAALQDMLADHEQEQELHSVDLTKFRFRSEAAAARTIPSSDLRSRYQGNIYTESARWKALEPHQQAYVNNQIGKALTRVLEKLETPEGRRTVQFETKNYGSVAAAQNAIVKRTVDATRDAAVDKFHQAAAQEREELERVKKKGSVSDTARAAGHASNLRLQVRFGTILCVVQNPKRTFACARA